MLGHVVMRVFQKDHRFRVVGTQMNDRQRPGYLNVREGARGLHWIFETYGGFDYCINCIGITANKINAQDPRSVTMARRINSVFPLQLAKAAKAFQANVIHISTDGVFRGTKPSYFEDSRPDCCDVYGKTKLAGEVDADHVLNIRCSIIGPSPYERGGLWEWFAGLPKTSRVQGFSNHIWHGVTTLQFAQLCQRIILKNCFQDLRRKSGVYHFAPNRPLNKYALLDTLKRFLKKDVSIERSVQGKGKVRRILRSRFKGLRKIFPYGTTMRDAVGQLLIYERKKNG